MFAKKMRNFIVLEIRYLRSMTTFPFSLHLEKIWKIHFTKLNKSKGKNNKYSPRLLTQENVYNKCEQTCCECSKGNSITRFFQVSRNISAS